MANGNTDSSVAGASVEKPQDFGEGGPGVVKRWAAEINRYNKQFDNWQKRGKKIVKRYRDERTAAEKGEKRFNVLWANLQILKPALYSRTAKPQIERTYHDKDPVGRLAARILQRATSFSVDAVPFDDVMKQVRDDLLLPGRGTAWVRYEPTFAADVEKDESGMPTQPPNHESVAFDYVYWRDFGHSPARQWEQVDAVWRKVQMNRQALVRRFGPGLGKEITLNAKLSNVDSIAVEEHKDVFQLADIYEIWDKTKKEALWISLAHDAGPLDVQDDPLTLTGFFPCPKPLYATTTSDNLVPIPDYAQYQDQAAEIDLITERISMLTEALKVSGVYDGTIPVDLNELFKRGDNYLMKVDNWAALAEKGGIKGAIAYLPIQEIASVLQKLFEARAAIKQDLFEVTGISDIVRGQVDPREKLGQSKLKGRFANLRLQDGQRDVARFARDVVALFAEVIAEHFQPQMIQRMVGNELIAQEAEPIIAQMQADPARIDPNTRQPIPLTEDEKAQVGRGMFAKAIELLRSDPGRSFRIDIETDSTVALDRDAEQGKRVELLGALTPFLQASIEAIQIFPAVAPLLGEMMLFGLRGFNVGRPLEAKFEEFVEQLDQFKDAPTQPQGGQEAPPPTEDPAMAEREMVLKEADGGRADKKLEQERELSDRKRADDREVNLAKAEASGKPTTIMQVDGQDALQNLASTMQNLAVAQGEAITKMASESQAALAQAMQALADAISVPRSVVFDEQGRVKATIPDPSLLN